MPRIHRVRREIEDTVIALIDVLGTVFGVGELRGVDHKREVVNTREAFKSQRSN